MRFCCEADAVTRKLKFGAHFTRRVRREENRKHIHNMAPMHRRSGVGPLVVRTGSSSCSNEEASTPRTARVKTMPRHEGAKPLPNDENVRRSLSTARVRSSTNLELAGKQEQKGNDPTLAFVRGSSVQSQSNFEELHLSPVKSRLTRNSSISTCMGALLRVPAMMHRTPSMEMIEDFQNLEVQTDAADDKPSMFHRTPCMEVHEDGQ